MANNERGKRNNTKLTFPTNFIVKAKLVKTPYSETGDWREAEPKSGEYGDYWIYEWECVTHPKIATGTPCVTFMDPRKHQRMCELSPEKGQTVAFHKAEMDDGKTFIRIGLVEEEIQVGAQQPEQPQLPQNTQMEQPPRARQQQAYAQPVPSNAGKEIVDGWLHIKAIAQALGMADGELTRSFIGSVFIEWNRKGRPALPHPSEYAQRSEPGPREPNGPDEPPPHTDDDYHGDDGDIPF